MRETERRSTSQIVELRAGKDGGLGTLHGYAAKFGVLSQNLGGFVERIAPGAFDKSIADDCRVLARAHHKDSGLLGTTEAGTLTLTVDEVGLMYDVPLPDTTAGRDCSVLAKRGDLRYSSFAFDCIEDEWGFTEQDFPVRTLLQVQLRDVAPVNSPAYMDATVALRSLSDLVHVPVDDLAGKPVEEIRGLILGEKTPACCTGCTCGGTGCACRGTSCVCAEGCACCSCCTCCSTQTEVCSAAPVASAPRSNASPSEQRDTHSLVTVQLLQLKLDEIK